MDFLKTKMVILVKCITFRGGVNTFLGAVITEWANKEIEDPSLKKGIGYPCVSIKISGPCR